MSFENEMQSFKEWIEVFEDNTILLVDTYETIEGVKNAINIGIQLRKKGKKLGGIRLDSGDLLSLSKEARQMLDEHAFYDTKIFATNELDEIKIESLKKGGCKVNAWGVGTHLVTGHPKGALDGVYKLSAIKESLNCNWIFKAKISQNEEKVSTPGILDVRRIKEAGLFVKDVIYSNPLAYEASKNSEGLLVKIYKEGRLVYKKPSLEEIRKKVKEELAALPSDVKLLENPKKYSVFWDEEILKIRKGLGLNG
jgi:nicotinate phosphoribosyltransferase